MFADLLLNRPVTLPKGPTRVIQDGIKPITLSVNSHGTYSADVRRRIVALFDDLESITVPIICAEIGFTAASANRHIKRMEDMNLIIKRESGRRGSGRVNSWGKGMAA